MKSYILSAFCALFLIASLEAQSSGHVEITSPKDGETVTTEALFKFKVLDSEWSVVPAGPVTPKTGHHHILIDMGAMSKGKVIPNDVSHLHFGKGQTEATIKLTPGEHQITLQFADGAHVSYGPEWSHTIRVKVK